jgi:cytidylate kinase
MQREIAAKNDVVMDGRDIGTTVLPDANLKIYLTASADARAKRRYDELVMKGQDANLDKIKSDIMERDYADMHREISPLVQADDAILIDSSDMSIDEVVQKVRELVR